MNKQLLLPSIRGALIRLEETIIFALIERAQFMQNLDIYRAGAHPSATGQESILGFLLHRTERIHAAMRRYTSPDEVPFFHDLPQPILPELRFDENPLRPNSVNINDRIRMIYETRIVPSLCSAGDDQQYGSSAVCDVACLQALSKRIHYGKFVAESKRQQQPRLFAQAMRSGGGAERLRELITDQDVEALVLERVRRKADTYGRELIDCAAAGCLVPAQIIEVMYRDFVIPMTKDVEVEYLLETAE